MVTRSVRIWAEKQKVLGSSSVTDQKSKGVLVSGEVQNTFRAPSSRLGQPISVAPSSVCMHVLQLRVVVMLILKLELAGKNVNICCYGNNVAKSKFKPGCQSGQKNDLASYRVTNNTAFSSLSKRLKTNHLIICCLLSFKLQQEKKESGIRLLWSRRMLTVLLSMRNIPLTTRSVSSTPKTLQPNDMPLAHSLTLLLFFHFVFIPPSQCLLRLELFSVLSSDLLHPSPPT